MPSPTATPSGADPQFIPALSAIQMVGPHLGWAVGAYAIFSTADGAHWSKQYASTEQFVGVDFVSATTGWAVGVRSLLGTVDGGRTWRTLGEAAAPIRSVHFVNSQQGWAIAGGSSPTMVHGWLLPADGASVVTTNDGGQTWSSLHSPSNPQTVCFSSAGQGWLGTEDGGVYLSSDQGQTWTRSLQRPAQDTAYGLGTLLECAAPRALWVLFVGGGAGMSHEAYIAYATSDGSTWRAVMEETYIESHILPGVPQGPDSYPPSFSVVDAMDAAFVGDGPATMVTQCVIASNGGSTLRRTGSIANSSETFGAAFTSVTTGWVLTRIIDGDYVIEATGDGGYHWSQQLAVAPSSAG